MSFRTLWSVSWLFEGCASTLMGRSWSQLRVSTLARYPSVQPERGVAALGWFVDHHTSFNQTLKDSCQKASALRVDKQLRRVERGSAIYCLKVRTAIGTSFPAGGREREIEGERGGERENCVVPAIRGAAACRSSTPS